MCASSLKTVWNLLQLESETWDFVAGSDEEDVLSDKASLVPWFSPSADVKGAAVEAEHTSYAVVSGGPLSAPVMNFSSHLPSFNPTVCFFQI